MQLLCPRLPREPAVNRALREARDRIKGDEVGWDDEPYGDTIRDSAYRIPGCRLPRALEMNSRYLIAAFFALFWIAGCSSVQVRSDWDQSVEFSQFETIAFMDDNAQAMNGLIDGRIRRALIDDLTAKGFEMVASAEEADLVLGFQVVTEDRRSYSTVSTGWSQRGYRHSRRGAWSSPGMTTVTTQTRVRTYTVGALVVAIFEGENKELVWEASGSRRIDPAQSPSRSESLIRDVVERVLRDFPPSS